MKFIIGLGNKGEEYANTRHNAGKIIAGLIEKKLEDTKVKGKVKFIDSKEFMNNSGRAVAPFIKSKKDLQNLIVIYDDIDLPIGRMKISFNRSSGGHRGVQSIIRTLKSEEFIRIRIGVAPMTLTGKTKKPKGEDKVINFILGKFKEAEIKELKKISKKVAEALEIIILESKEKAMTLYN